MESRARFLGHPAHQMLIVFPLGLLGASVVFDLLFRVLDRPVMAEVAYWTMAGGLLTGLVAAPLGLVDWLAIPKGTRARAVGALHGAGNVLVVALFLASWLTRHAAPAYPPVVAAVFAWLGLALAGVTAWLGGELVSRLGIGVHDQANVNAPSSLRDRTASATPSPRRP
jgi:uncharacterized membrane protein